MNTSTKSIYCSWMEDGIDPLNVISAIDRIIGDAEEILTDDPGETAVWQGAEGPTTIYPAVIV